MIVVMMMMRGTGGLRTDIIDEIMMIKPLAHDCGDDDERHKRVEDRLYRRDDDEVSDLVD